MNSISKPDKWEYTDLIKNNRSCKLLVAARAGRHKDIVQLIDEGADVNYRDPYNGRTCLINAAFGKTLKYWTRDMIVYSTRSGFIPFFKFPQIKIVWIAQSSDSVPLYSVTYTSQYSLFFMAKDFEIISSYDPVHQC